MVGCRGGVVAQHLGELLVEDAPVAASPSVDCLFHVAYNQTLVAV